MIRAMAAPQWFDTAFGRDYLAVYPHRDAASARREVAGLVARGVGATGGRVLDLGCGFGRHLAALREHGIDAWGLDRSLALLQHADPALRGRFARGDFRALPFQPGIFGAVLMLFSSFGYFGDAENAHVLDEIARVLVPNGLAVLDLMNPVRVRATLVPESRLERGALAIHERRTLEHGGTRVVKDVRLASAEGERGWREDVRLYAPDELDALLGTAGLRRLRTEGDFDGRPFAAGSPEPPRQIVWAVLERQ
jgi:SAM-dependent methyltransferase